MQNCLKGSTYQLGIIGRGLPKEPPCEIISKSVHQFRRRNRLKLFFLFIALVAILFKGTELFEHFWQKVPQETFLCNNCKIHPLVKEEKLFAGFSIWPFLLNRTKQVEQF